MSSITSWQVKGGKVKAMTDLLFLGSKITAESDFSQEIKWCLLLGRKAMTNLDSKKAETSLWRQVPYGQSYGFSSSHSEMWELDHKEGWVQKNWCFQIVILEKTLESPLDCMEIKLVNPKGNQSWIFISIQNIHSVAEVEVPTLWPTFAKHWLIEKHPDAGKDWRQKAKNVAEDEMIREYHKLSGHQFEPTPGDSGRQRSLVCYSPWTYKELDTTWGWNNSNIALLILSKKVLKLIWPNKLFFLSPYWL